jgi:hypothetical protein
MRFTSCRFVGFVVLLTAPAFAVAADEIEVPIEIQAALVAKLAAYDRSLKARAGDKVLVLIVTRDGDPESQKVAKAVANSVESKEILGLPVVSEIAIYKDASTLAADCKAKRAAIAYLTPGLGAEVEKIAKSLEGADLLTVSAVAEYVEKGAVLGFSLASGRPKMLFHLAQAGRQNVKLPPNVLSLMKMLP